MPVQQKTGVFCQNPRMDVRACTSDIYPDDGQWFIAEKTRENAQAGGFSLHLDFLFELNEVCM